MSRDTEWGCDGHQVRHGSYDEIDHSDQEIYVYDQCCRNCRFYDAGALYCTRNYHAKVKYGRGWCEYWKGRDRC